MRIIIKFKNTQLRAFVNHFLGVRFSTSGLVLLIILLSALPSINLRGQESSVQVSTKDLSKDNQKLQKELNRLRMSAKRELKSEFPEVPAEQVDSLIRELASPQENMEQVFADSSQTYFAQLKNKLISDLRQTPEKLPVAEEIQETIGLFQGLESIEDAWKKRGKAFELFNASELTKLDKKFMKLQSSFEGYKKEFQDWDQALLNRVEHVEEVAIIKKQLERVKNYKALPDGYRDQVDKFQSNEFVQNMLEEKAEELVELGNKTLQEKFDMAQSKLDAAKDEFPDLPSVEDAPPKYNPHTDLPFLKRLKLGGNIQYNKKKPESVDGALTVLYPINKRWTLGTELGALLYQKKTDKPGAANLMSLRGFMRYTVLNSLFLQANIETTKMRVPDLNDQGFNESWKTTGLLGVGRKFKVGSKILMSSTVFYDLFFDPLETTRKGPFVLRVGFELEK